MSKSIKEKILGRGLSVNLLGPLLGLFYWLCQSSSISHNQLLLLFLWFSVPFILYLKGGCIWKSRDSLGLISVFVATLFTFKSVPPFENDFYRYFFEGNALLKGLNPYEKAPAELFHLIPYRGVFQIGHPDLSAIYPPLTLLFFGLLYGLAKFDLSLTLLIFSLINALLIWALLGWLQNKKSPYLNGGVLSALLAYLMREMVFQYHFELWAFLPFVLAFHSDKPWKSLFGFLLSLQLKLIGTFGILVFFFKRQYREVVCLFFLLVCSFLLFEEFGLFRGSGWQSFSARWLFAPGFLSILYPLIDRGLSFSSAKGISGGIFACLSLWGIMRGRHRNPLMTSVFIICSFFYFAPVYNAWYALWPGVLLISLGRKEGIYTLLLSPLCYSYFLVPHHPLIFGVINLLIHLPYFFFLKSYFREIRLATNHS